jgi:ribonuclease Z
VTLGTGGAHADQNRRGPAIAVASGREIVLVDAGRGVAESLRAARIPIAQPFAVLLTSLLPENTVGLDDLLAEAWLAGRSEPLRLFGPPGTAALARNLDAALRPAAQAWQAAQRSAAVPVGFEVEEVSDGFALERSGLTLRAGALPGGPVPALAWRVEWRGLAAVVSGAGWAPDALAEFARGAQLLVSEAAFLPTPEQAREMGIEEDPEQLRREAALHTGIDAVGEIARRAGAKTLVLVRLRPPPVYDLQVTSVVDDRFEGRVIVAEDGGEITP